MTQSLHPRSRRRNLQKTTQAGAYPPAAQDGAGPRCSSPNRGCRAALPIATPARPCAKDRRAPVLGQEGSFLRNDGRKTGRGNVGTDYLDRPLTRTATKRNSSGIGRNGIRAYRNRATGFYATTPPTPRRLDVHGTRKCLAGQRLCPGPHVLMAGWRPGRARYSGCYDLRSMIVPLPGQPAPRGERRLQSPAHRPASRWPGKRGTPRACCTAWH